MTSTNQKVIKNIKDNYRQVEKSIVEQLYMKYDLHNPTTGSCREDAWEQIFEMILPKKFIIEHSVFIIDSGGNVSKEVDLAIMDETYTPYIFRYGRLKFIPIEAVAVVVECKSKSIDPDGIDKWVDSITELKTATNSIARIATMIAVGAVATQQSTRPIKILCRLNDKEETENKLKRIKEKFDFVLTAVKVENGKENSTCKIVIQETSKLKNLFEWYENLNFNGFDNDSLKDRKRVIGEDKLDISLDDYKVLDQEKTSISLLSFNFQLNQLLMLINNPLLFPHRAYVDCFNQKG